MSENEVLSLMASSNSEREWTQNCNTVRAAFDGVYPLFWFRLILQSGVAKATAAKWGSDAEIHVYRVGPKEVPNA